MESVHVEEYTEEESSEEEEEEKRKHVKSRSKWISVIFVTN